MSLGARIGQGRTAEIFAWEEGRILKLFHEWVRPEHVQHEAAVAGMVHAAGLPVPAIDGQTVIDGRHGIVYDRLDGPTLLRHVVDHAHSVARLARQLAELHARIHTIQLAALPSMRDRLQERIESAEGLPAAARAAALHILESQPDPNTVCHGDFHPDNVLMTENGPMIIDWSEAARGHPLADVARTSLMISLGEPPPDAPESLRWRLNQVRGPLHDVYLGHYLDQNGATQQQVQAWQLPVTVARLAQRIPEEEGHVVGRIEWLADG